MNKHEPIGVAQTGTNVKCECCKTKDATVKWHLQNGGYHPLEDTVDAVNAQSYYIYTCTECGLVLRQIRNSKAVSSIEYRGVESNLVMNLEVNP